MKPKVQVMVGSGIVVERKSNEEEEETVSQQQIRKPDFERRDGVNVNSIQSSVSSKRKKRLRCSITQVPSEVTAGNDDEKQNKKSYNNFARQKQLSHKREKERIRSKI